MRLSLLGPVQIERDGQPDSDMSLGKPLALLSYLIAQQKQLPREHLADLFWQDLPVDRGRANLSWMLHKLTSTLPVCLAANRHSVQFLRSERCWIDIDAFQDLIDQGDTVSLAKAAALYRGDFLEGLDLDGCADFELWLVAERERWRQREELVLNSLIAHNAEKGTLEEALRYAQRLLDFAPWREETHCQVMRLLAEQGQRSAALAQFAACCRALDTELGVVPTADTVALYEQIRDNTITQRHTLTFEKPGLNATSPRHNMPASLTPFIGRASLLTKIRTRLLDPSCRLLTLVGQGGSGKTRLAVEAIAGQIHGHADGIFFVSLTPLRDVAAIIPAIAQAIGFTFSGGGSPKTQLLNYLRQKHMLFILDNYEHLLSPPRPTSGGESVAIDILQTAPDVKILVTSRTRLNVPAEHLIPVGGMDVPSDGGAFDDHTRCSAVQLFLQSARQVNPAFSPTSEDFAHIAHICRFVQGLPLGILLAAAWVQMLTPVEIASELSQHRSTSLDFLETDWSAVPKRHRSLRTVFEYTWQQLTSREQEILQALSVLRGGGTRDALQHITGATLRDLRALVNRSLLERAPTGRYVMHELLRQYAMEKLNTSLDGGHAVRDSHASFYVNVLERWSVDAKGPRQSEALAEIERDIDNARGAWDFANAQKHVDWLDQGLEGLCRYYQWRGYPGEGEKVCHRTLECLSEIELHRAATEANQVLSRLWAWQGHFARAQGKCDLGTVCFEHSMNILERPGLRDYDMRSEKAFLLHVMTDEALDIDLDKAQCMAQESLNLYQAIDDRWGAARALGQLAHITWRLGKLEETRRLAEEAMPIWRALGDDREITWCALTLGMTATHLGQPEKAEGIARETLDAAQRIGDAYLIGCVRVVVCSALVDSGKFAEARLLREINLASQQDRGNHHGEIGEMVFLGLTIIHLGAYDAAQTLAKTSLSLSQEPWHRRNIGDAWKLLGFVDLALGQYTASQEWLQKSVSMHRQLGAALNYGTTLSSQACAACGLGQLDAARNLLHEALLLAVKTRHHNMALLGITAMVVLLISEAKVERAVELYAMISRYPHVANSRWFGDVVGKPITGAVETLAPHVIRAAQARGSGIDLWDSVKALLAELEE